LLATIGVGDFCYSPIGIWIYGGVSLTWQTIALFHDVGVLEHIVVVGSWAEYLYEESGVIPGFRSSFRTQDFDVLLRNIRLPKKHFNLAAELTRQGYLMMQDSHTGANGQ
jgi:ABC-type branched-subunit amino acid transport system ATPase component